MDDTTWETVDRLVDWLDAHSRRDEQTERLLRIMKLSEEVGEVGQGSPVNCRNQQTGIGKWCACANSAATAALPLRLQHLGDDLSDVGAVSIVSQMRRRESKFEHLLSLLLFDGE